MTNEKIVALNDEILGCIQGGRNMRIGELEETMIKVVDEFWNQFGKK